MKKLFLLFLNIYQKLPKPFPPSCIYIPSCSEYAKQAFERHSMGKALKLTIGRLMRCHPFCRGGFDPVK